MRTQKEYWDKKIREWSSSSYGKTDKISFLEKIATYFRAVNSRKEVALKLIGPKAKNKIIIDLGCGLGEFSLGLLLRHNPKKIIAYDISEVAIKQVKKLTRGLDKQDKIEFYAQDVTKLKELPNFDILVGLGFIDYLNSDQMIHLFKMIDNRPFLFSYFEKKYSFFNFFHKIYITIQRCPGAFKYTRKEIRTFVPKNSKLYFIWKSGLQFITNSPKIR